MLACRRGALSTWGCLSLTFGAIVMLMVSAAGPPVALSPPSTEPVAGTGSESPQVPGTPGPPTVREVVCDFACETYSGCYGTNVPCPACDDWGSSTCGDVTSKTYPAPGGPIMTHVVWSECSGLAFRTTGDVECYRTQACAEGPWTSWTMCSNGVACVGVPVPLLCQTCVPVGPVTVWAHTNVECWHDSRCDCDEQEEP